MSITPFQALIEVLEECMQESKAKGLTTCTFRITDLRASLELLKAKEEIRALKDKLGE